jgi:tRNA(Arg) A34 adenosine deaminase TadA
MSDPEDTDRRAMRAAIAEARAARRRGDRPYGAALVTADGTLRLACGNEQVTRDDVTAHAEVMLVREATRRLGAAALAGATVHASGEPCAMCAGALYWAGVARIVWAASQPAMAAAAGGDLLPMRCADALAGASRPVRVEGPLLEAESLAVIRGA